MSRLGKAWNTHKKEEEQEWNGKETKDETYRTVSFETRGENIFVRKDKSQRGHKIKKQQWRHESCCSSKGIAKRGNHNSAHPVSSPLPSSFKQRAREIKREEERERRRWMRDAKRWTTDVKRGKLNSQSRSHKWPFFFPRSVEQAKRIKQETLLSSSFGNRFVLCFFRFCFFALETGQFFATIFFRHFSFSFLPLSACLLIFLLLSFVFPFLSFWLSLWLFLSFVFLSPILLSVVSLLFLLLCPFFLSSFLYLSRPATFWRAPILQRGNAALWEAGVKLANQVWTRSSSAINKISSALMLHTLTFSSVLANV